MKRRGQVTLFIVLGIVLLLVFLSIYLITSQYKQERSREDTSKSVKLIEDMKPVESYATDCILRATALSLVLNGYHGGYTNTSPYAFYNESGTLATAGGGFVNDSNNMSVPYYIENKNMHRPTLEQLEKKIERFAEVRFDMCMENISIFEDIGLHIELPEVDFETAGWHESNLSKLNITIGNNSVFTKIYYPIKISRDDTTRTIDTFGGTVPIRFGLIYNQFVMNITDMINSSWSAGSDFHIYDDFNCSENADNMTVYSHDDSEGKPNTYIIHIVDKEYGNGYRFQFAVSDGTLNPGTGSQCSS